MNIAHQFFDKATALTGKVFDCAPAQRVKQIHSSKVIGVSAPQAEWIEADGIVTRTPNLPIGVITADCAPVLLHADGVIGAAHAGWQGALGGVLENTIKVMDCPPADIHAVIGPCITQQSYEVSIGFEKPFLDQNPMAEQFFINGQEGKLHFDLSGYCAYRLATSGVRNIHIDGTDTLTHPDYHSHRGGAEATERNLSAIMIKG